jgi:hypothetical protein
MSELSRRALSIIAYTFLQMHNTNFRETDEFDFLFAELDGFIEMYQITSEEDREHFLDLVREELEEGLYLQEGLDSFNEGMAIFFRDKLYDGSDNYKNDPLYNKIIDIAEEVYSKGRNNNEHIG